MLRQLRPYRDKACGAFDACPAFATLGAGPHGCRAHSSSTPREVWFQTPVASLEFERQVQLDPSATASPLRRAALRLLGYYSRDSRHMRAGEALLKAVYEQVDAPSFPAAMEVPDSFQHQHSLLALHIWMLLQRLRTEGKDGKRLGQAMYDGFQDEVERRARATGAKVRFSKFLKEYEEQFFGSSKSYDQAMDGKIDLAAALSRNVYLLDHDKQHAAALLARYVRREVACLALTPSQAVMDGNIRFTAGFHAGLAANPAPEQAEMAVGEA